MVHLAPGDQESLGAVFFSTPLDTGVMPRKSRGEAASWATIDDLTLRYCATGRPCHVLLVRSCHGLFSRGILRRSLPCGCTPIHPFVNTPARKQSLRPSGPDTEDAFRPSRGRKGRLIQTYARLIGRVHGSCSGWFRAARIFPPGGQEIDATTTSSPFMLLNVRQSVPITSSRSVRLMSTVFLLVLLPAWHLTSRAGWFTRPPAP
jgi:hypothetical protein